jgi:hypothetical protein
MTATRIPPGCRTIPASSVEPPAAGTLTRVALITLSGFLGITAAGGGLGLLLGWITPGMDLLDGSPFSTYVIPGLMLLTVVGGSALLATAAVVGLLHLAAPMSAVAG